MCEFLLCFRSERSEYEWGRKRGKINFALFDLLWKMGRAGGDVYRIIRATHMFLAPVYFLPGGERRSGHTLNVG